MEKWVESTRVRTVIKGVAGLVPWIGQGASMMDELLVDQYSKEQTERLELIVEELESGVSDFQGPIELWGADPVLRATHATISASLRTQRRQKVRAFARLLRAGLETPPRLDLVHEHEDYLKILDDVSVRELHLLYLLDQHEKENGLTLADEGPRSDKFWSSFRSTASAELHIPEAEFTAFIARLTRTGLIDLITGTYYDYTGGHARITGGYRRLASLIETAGSLFDSGDVA